MLIFRAPSVVRFGVLRRSARPQPPREHCELCDAALAERHAHLVELSNRRLVCACDACAILFDNPATGKYRRVPLRVQLLAEFRLPEEAWAALHLPIDLAFFLYSTAAERVLAFYPSPAGATEALVPLEAWQLLADENPVLNELQPDVEALLVNRIRKGGNTIESGSINATSWSACCERTGADCPAGRKSWEAMVIFTGLRGGAPHA